MFESVGVAGFCWCFVDWGDDDEKKKPAYFDDDGVARTAEGRFLNLQPHFAASDYREI
ncbi:hypothetical protein HanIR_Chr06g0272081 [Helianthus annuus]|nr:hypothetical protein HanIR_Chr06g0272081 [Helianthus annuus]